MMVLRALLERNIESVIFPLAGVADGVLTGVALLRPLIARRIESAIWWFLFTITESAVCAPAERHNKAAKNKKDKRINFISKKILCKSTPQYHYTKYSFGEMRYSTGH